MPAAVGEHERLPAGECTPSARGLQRSVRPVVSLPAEECDRPPERLCPVAWKLDVGISTAPGQASGFSE